MLLRSYIHDQDCQTVLSWITSERIHAMWCANKIPFPLTVDGLRAALEQDAKDWGGRAWIAVEENGKSIGFFVLSINQTVHSAFLKYVVIDPKLRGNGFGTRMIDLLLKQLFEANDAVMIECNVFDINTGARLCYANVGMTEEPTSDDSFLFYNEKWQRIHMSITRKHFFGRCSVLEE